jgi:hypothetical protein
MKWGDFGNGRAFFEVDIVEFIGQCAVCDLIYSMSGQDVLFWDCILCGIQSVPWRFHSSGMWCCYQINTHCFIVLKSTLHAFLGPVKHWDLITLWHSITSFLEQYWCDNLRVNKISFVLWFLCVCVCVCVWEWVYANVCPITQGTLCLLHKD